MSVGAASSARAQNPDLIQSPSALKRMSLEELFTLEVTSVSKQPERLWHAPSAIQVITGDDIRRSGATSIPEALRLAHNVQVAQVNAHDWAVTSRGFNGIPLSSNSLADKLLVLIDGRSIYTPLFGGVFWDVQHVPLEDVDRIEVITGPGGTLWGANAVNGVINIVTKRAKETQGVFAAGTGGSALRDLSELRYGGSAGSRVSYRVYGQRFERADTKTSTNKPSKDAWDFTQGGFRIDIDAPGENALTFQGDAYGGREGTPTGAKTDGQNALARWTHRVSERSELIVQSYFDRTWRSQRPRPFSDQLRTFDLEAQHRFPIGARHGIVCGAGARAAVDEVKNTPALSFKPGERDMRLYTAFAEDAIQIQPDRLIWTLGSKFESNAYSGLEVQPSTRLAWTPRDRVTLWGAVSRAVRAPSRFDTDLSTAAFVGDPDFEAEKVTAYEMGLRLRPWTRVTMAVSGFDNYYDDVRSLNLNVGPPMFYYFANDQKAHTRGAEVTGTCEPVPRWRLRGGYNYVYETFAATSSKVIAGSDKFEATDPRHRAQLESSLDLPRHVQLDVVGRWVDSLRTGVSGRRVPAYTTYDARLAASVGAVELSVVGQNLWADRHTEFGMQMLRSVYARVACRFQ